MCMIRSSAVPIFSVYMVIFKTIFLPKTDDLQSRGSIASDQIVAKYFIKIMVHYNLFITRSVITLLWI